MAAFEYIAIDGAGKRTTGIITSETARSARRELRLRDLMAVNLNPVTNEKGRPQKQRGRIGAKERVLLMRQLAVLLQSGLPVEQALIAASASDASPAVQRALHGVRAEVTEGARLADAMKIAPQAFSPLMRSVTQAGEMSGQLGGVMERLATYLERSFQLRQKVQTALIYPALLALMAFAMVIALMLIIVPRLVDQFDLFGSELPAITEFVIALSNRLRSDWPWLVGGLLLLGVSLTRGLRHPAMRRRIDRLVLALPLIGKLTRIVCAGRFARVFATLSGSGATVLDALHGARAATGNTVFEDAANTIAERVREGGSFAAALQATCVFPPMMVHMVASGETGRDLAGMMTRAADFLDNEFETGSAALLSLLEPLIIVFLGGVVGLIVLSIMLPILQLNTMAIG